MQNTFVESAHNLVSLANIKTCIVVRLVTRLEARRAT
jgi:hypothetical protein